MKIIWRVIITLIILIIVYLWANKVGLDVVGLISFYVLALIGYIAVSRNRNQ